MLAEINLVTCSSFTLDAFHGMPVRLGSLIVQVLNKEFDN